MSTCSLPTPLRAPLPTLRRRDVHKAGGAALGSAALAGCAMNSIGTPDAARVLVVGGGFGGATAAKYVRLLSGGKIDVVLVEPDAAFVSRSEERRVGQEC